MGYEREDAQLFAEWGVGAMLPEQLAQSVEPLSNQHIPSQRLHSHTLRMHMDRLCGLKQLQCFRLQWLLLCPCCALHWDHIQVELSTATALATWPPKFTWIYMHESLHITKVR